MACSADYYLEWNSRLDSTLQTKPKRQIFCNSEPLKNERKYPFVNIGSTYYQHWQHRLFGANYALQS